MTKLINIDFLNTLREVQLCISLGYIVNVRGIKIKSVAELFMKYDRLKRDLVKINNPIVEKAIIGVLNAISAFFFRCHISEEGDELHRNEIRELKLSDDYWTTL